MRTDEILNRTAMSENTNDVTEWAFSNVQKDVCLPVISLSLVGMVFYGLKSSFGFLHTYTYRVHVTEWFELVLIVRNMEL